MQGNRRSIVETHSQEPSEYMKKWLRMTEMGYNTWTRLRILRESKDRMINFEEGGCTPLAAQLRTIAKMKQKQVSGLGL